MKIKTTLKAIISIFSVIHAQRNNCLEETLSLSETIEEETYMVEKSDKLKLEYLLR